MLPGHTSIILKLIYEKQGNKDDGLLLRVCFFRTFALMMLFDEMEFFEEAAGSFTSFPLPEASLMLWEGFFTKNISDHYFKVLRDTSPWQQRVRKMYDKTVADPRLTAYYGGENGHSWTKLLLEIKEQVGARCGSHFDRVLLNYYRNGNDSVSWHSDTLPKDGKHHEIASVTFGATRSFKVRHKTRKDVPQLDIPLKHGSLLLMSASLQDYYEHHVPKVSRPVGPRINLTFRISESSKPVYFMKEDD